MQRAFAYRREERGQPDSLLMKRRSPTPDRRRAKRTGPPANPKIGELLDVRQLPAERQRSRVSGRGGGSGGGLEGDGVAEGFELADVAALAAFGVDAGGIEV